MQSAIDGAVVSGDRDLLSVLGLGFVLLAVIQVAISVLRSWVVLYLGSNLNLQWLANVFSHLLRLPVSYFEKRHLGDVVSRFSAINTIQRTLTSSFVEALIDGVMAALTLAMMLVYSLTLTLVALAAVAVYGVLRASFYDPLKRATEDNIVTPRSSKATSWRRYGASSRSSSSDARRSDVPDGSTWWWTQ